MDGPLSPEDYYLKPTAKHSLCESLEGFLDTGEEQHPHLKLFLLFFLVKEDRQAEKPSDTQSLLCQQARRGCMLMSGHRHTAFLV